MLLVRHARAGQRESYVGDDDQRPLDAKGRRQAAALVGELSVFAPLTVHSAPLERCRGTVAPLAEKLGTRIAAGADAVRGGLSGRPGRPPGAGSSTWRPRSGPAQTTVVCSQGGVIPGVVKSLAARDDVPVAGVSTPKAAYWFLSFDGRRLVQADPYPAPRSD